MKNLKCRDGGLRHYCVWGQYCAAVGTASTVCVGTLLCSCRHSKYCVWGQYCAAVGIASTVCGDSTVQL